MLLPPSSHHPDDNLWCTAVVWGWLKIIIIIIIIIIMIIIIVMITIIIITILMIICGAVQWSGVG